MNGVAFRDAIIFVKKWKIIAIVCGRLLEESGKSCKFVGYKQEYAPITNMNKGTTRNTESDFEHLKDWQDNPNLDDYLSDTHWNQHVNLLIYTYLKARYHGNEVGVYINMALLNGENAFNIDYNQIYGVMFNEAYSFCSYVLNDPVPQTKIAYLEKKAEELCHIQAAAPIISYNILVMVSYILCFANDHNDAVGRFLQSLSFYNNSHVFGDEFHHFENYIKIGLRTVAAIIIDSRLQPPGKLRPGYDYKSKDDYLRKTLPLYREFAEEFEKNIRDAEEKRRSEKITSDGAPKPETTVTPEKKKPDPLSKQLSNEISTYVNNINKCPQTIESIGELVVKAKFKYDFMKAIICGLKSELLMDKAILVIVDAWERYTQKKDDICYETIEHFRDYAYDQNGMYEVNRPIRMLKYIDIEKDLEGIKDSELKRRRIDAKFKKELESSQRIDAGKTKKLREPVVLKTATHSFILKLKNVNEKERNERIATFFSDLSRNGKYIHEKTNAQDFFDNFTGKHTAEKIVWTAEIKQLLYLISTLNKSGLLKWNTEKPKPGIRQMICIVFQIQEHEYNEVEGKTEKQPVTCINDIDVSRLNTTMDTSDEGLDPIIRRLLFGEASTEEGVKGLIDTEGFSK